MLYAAVLVQLILWWIMGRLPPCLSSARASEWRFNTKILCLPGFFLQCNVWRYLCHSMSDFNSVMPWHRWRYCTRFHTPLCHRITADEELVSWWLTSISLATLHRSIASLMRQWCSLWTTCLSVWPVLFDMFEAFWWCWISKDFSLLVFSASIRYFKFVVAVDVQWMLPWFLA